MQGVSGSAAATWCRPPPPDWASVPCSTRWRCSRASPCCSPPTPMASCWSGCRATRGQRDRHRPSGPALPALGRLGGDLVMAVERAARWRCERIGGKRQQQFLPARLVAEKAGVGSRCRPGTAAATCWPLGACRRPGRYPRRRALATAGAAVRFLPYVGGSAGGRGAAAPARRAPDPGATMSDQPAPTPETARIGIVVISDRAYKGVYADQGRSRHPRATLADFLASQWEPVPTASSHHDERQRIEASLRELCDQLRCHLVITTGGTGPAARDVTPEATEGGVRQAAAGFRRASCARIRSSDVPTAILSRQTASRIRGSTMIINCPGKPNRAFGRCLEAVFPAVPYGVELLERHPAGSPTPPSSTPTVRHERAGRRHPRRRRQRSAWAPDKASLVRGGSTLLSERAAGAARGAGLAVLVVRTKPAAPAGPIERRVSFIEDAYPGRGADGGEMLQALKSSAQHGACVMTLPCDLPSITATCSARPGRCLQRLRR